MTDLKKSFEKEPKAKKIILVSAAAALVSTFLPWMSISFGTFASAAINGWHRFGILTVLASIALILLWLLPKVKVKFKLPAKEDMLIKVLSVVMLAGPVIFIMDSRFEFAFLGFGLYIALAAGVVATYFAFAKSKKTKKAEESKNEEKSSSGSKKKK
ncbi:hypothetical protein GF366_02240 [Candidatus Peregrinibacteria bacterium]|nr:hypothetical protein [Candidatus Peregrinibacteria bacterium]